MMIEFMIWRSLSQSDISFSFHRCWVSIINGFFSDFQHLYLSFFWLLALSLFFPPLSLAYALFPLSLCLSSQHTLSPTPLMYKPSLTFLFSSPKPSLLLSHSHRLSFFLSHPNILFPPVCFVPSLSLTRKLPLYTSPLLQAPCLTLPSLSHTLSYT